LSVSTLIDKYGQSVSHGTVSNSTDAVGGTVESWTYATAETALVQIEGGTDSVVGGSEARGRTAVFFFPSGKSISYNDRIRYAGADFEVRSVKIPHERPTTDRLSYVIVRAEQVLT